jgi:hypothetical protein
MESHIDIASIMATNKIRLETKNKINYVCINDAKILMFLPKHNHVVVYSNNTLDQLKYVLCHMLYGLKFYDFII